MAVETFNILPFEPGTPGSRRSLALYALLQRDIVLGKLAPRTALLELDLAQRFGVSQGTVREALLRLSEEGLVLRQSHRGTTVADCRAEDAQELIRLRHDIECRGVARALERRGPGLAEALADDLAAMRAAAEAGDEYRLSVHDRAFHMRLFRAADLPPIEPVLARTLVHVHRFKILQPAPGRDLTETANRHAVIVEAVAAGDLARIQAALSHHITTIVDLGPSMLLGERP